MCLSSEIKGRARVATEKQIPKQQPKEDILRTIADETDNLGGVSQSGAGRLGEQRKAAREGSSCRTGGQAKASRENRRRVASVASSRWGEGG